MRTFLVAAAALGLVVGQPGPGVSQTAIRDHSMPIVLLVQPDSAELRQMRARLGDEAFYITTDDAMWYQAQALQTLDSLRIPYATVTRRPLRFRVRGRMREYAWRDDARGWFALVYDGRSEPKVTAVIDLADDLRRARPGRSAASTPR
jgi:hypothetical protein